MLSYCRVDEHLLFLQSMVPDVAPSYCDGVSYFRDRIFVAGTLEVRASIFYVGFDIAKEEFHQAFHLQ